MPLTHVCVWDNKAGYRRVSIEEACSMYPYTVAANSGIFVCSLCAQNVGLTASGIKVRHFRHTSAEQKKECEDRAQAYARISVGYNCHPMPLRIRVTHGSYVLQLGFFHAASSISAGPRCQKIIITDDNGQKYIYSFERLFSEGITYLNVGSAPSASYRLSYEHPSPDLSRFWPAYTMGVEKTGSFFDGHSGKILHPGSKAFPYQDYYFLKCGTIEYVPHGISYESIAETRVGTFTTWHLYRIHVQDFSAAAARFFLKRSIFLTKKPVNFYPVWPTYIQDPYFLYHNDPRMYFHMQGDDTELNIYPPAISPQLETLDDGKLYKIYAASKEQLVSLGLSGVIDFSYLLLKNLNMVAASPQIQVKSIDGQVISEDCCSQLPKGKLVTIQSPFDGKVIILKNGRLLDIRRIDAEHSVTIDELSFGHEIQIFQSCDLIRTVKFERYERNIDKAAMDRKLAAKLRHCRKDRIPLPHSAAAVILQLKDYPLTKQWLLSQIRLGSIDRDAYLTLISAVHQKKG